MPSLIFLIVLLTTSIYAQEPHWHSPKYIEESFYDIALKNEYKKGDSFLRKWLSPIKIKIVHHIGDQELHTKLLKMHTDNLGQISNHSIQYVDNRDKANLIIYFTKSKLYNPLIKKYIGEQSIPMLKGSVCLGNFKLDKNNNIKNGLIIIPVDRARYHGKLVSCIVEEITQLMGLPNDSKTVYPTIFSDTNIYSLLTGLDYLLLKLLYQQELISGMTKKDLSTIIPKILSKWKKDGTIANAQSEVLKGELYHLLK